VRATAVLELWGAHRELQTVRARRAEIAVAVAPLLQARDSVDRLATRATAVQELAASTPSYTRALLDLALLLPRDAHLTRLYATGDTIEIEAVGTRAGAAIEALRAAPSLRDIRLRGIVDRQLEDGSTATERFTVRGTLVGDGAATTASSDGPGAAAPRAAGLPLSTGSTGGGL
jgi:hypothetical protein